jgi:hypothetical protein
MTKQIMLDWKKIAGLSRWEAEHEGARLVIQRVRNCNYAYDCVIMKGDKVAASFPNSGGLKLPLAKKEVAEWLAECNVDEVLAERARQDADWAKQSGDLIDGSEHCFRPAGCRDRIRLP